MPSLRQVCLGITVGAAEKTLLAGHPRDLLWGRACRTERVGGCWGHTASQGRRRALLYSPSPGGSGSFPAPQPAQLRLARPPLLCLPSPARPSPAHRSPASPAQDKVSTLQERCLTSLCWESCRPPTDRRPLVGAGKGAAGSRGLGCACLPPRSRPLFYTLSSAAGPQWPLGCRFQALGARGGPRWVVCMAGTSPVHLRNPPTPSLVNTTLGPSGRSLGLPVPWFT